MEVDWSIVYSTGIHEQARCDDSTQYTGRLNLMLCVDTLRGETCLKLEALVTASFLFFGEGEMIGSRNN
jgi:hypothetical protein